MAAAVEDFSSAMYRKVAVELLEKMSEETKMTILASVKTALTEYLEKGWYHTHKEEALALLKQDSLYEVLTGLAKIEYKSDGRFAKCMEEIARTPAWQSRLFEIFCLVHKTNEADDFTSKFFSQPKLSSLIDQANGTDNVTRDNAIVALCIQAIHARGEKSSCSAKAWESTAKALDAEWKRGRLSINDFLEECQTRVANSMQVSKVINQLTDVVEKKQPLLKATEGSGRLSLVWAVREPAAAGGPAIAEK